MDWKTLVSGLVLLLAASNCESAAVSAVSADLPELCPCLSINLCPRIYGASADDRKYLGEFMKCTKEGEVRCCGASMSSLANSKEAEEDKNKSGSSEEKTSQLNSNEIEDVRMEHLTIPPPVSTSTTTTEAPEIPTTTELIETTTFTTEEPLETTTSNVEEDSTTTEPPPPQEVTPRFGKGVEFIYAMTPVELERESKRRGKKLSFEEENVFIIMSQQFLEEEAANEIAQGEVTPLTTTTTTTDQPEAEIITTTVEGRFADEEASITTTEIPELLTTMPPPPMITTTTTRRPRIRKKIRVKVRKGLRLFPRVTNGSTELNLEDTETTTRENTRKNRDLEDNPKAKINHALYARRRHLLDMKHNITTTEAPDQKKSSADEMVAITTDPSIAEPSINPTESSSPSSSAQQNPALLNIFTKNAAKRRNFYNRRLLKNETKAEQTHAQEEKQIPKPVAVIKETKDEANKIEGQHRKVIEQVMAAVQQSGLKTTFDLADEIMDPEMAVRIANIQKMLTQEIMKTILAKIRVKAEAVDAQGGDIPTATSTTMATTAAVETENPINAAESKTPVHPYRGSKRYIDTNFLNAYENVIHKVEEKIKTHKTRGRPTNPPKSVATESPENVQHLLNNRRRTRISTTTASPVTIEAASVVETVTQLIEEFEKIQELESAPKKFKPSQLWEVIRESPPTSEQRRQDTDELSAPIDLLARDNEDSDSNGFVPIPAKAGSSLVGPAAQQHLRRSA